MLEVDCFLHYLKKWDLIALGYDLKETQKNLTADHSKNMF